jgi:hypothetical protein
LFEYARAGWRAPFVHDRAKPLFAAFEKTITPKSMIFGKPGTGFPKRSCSNLQRPAAIRPLGVTGTVPVTGERMDAIRNIKTMAGSPDADLLFDQRPAILRMVFVFLQRPKPFVNL